MRDLARRSTVAVLLDVLAQGDDPRKRFVQRGVTDICIEGYPRSANTFAVYMFRQANQVHIGHHTHSIVNIRRAIRFGVPCMVLLRDPKAAIVSLFIAKRWANLDDVVWRYISFYRWVESRLESVVIAEFDEVTTDYNYVIKKVNRKFGATFSYIKDLDASTKAVEAHMRTYVRDKKMDPTKWEPVPNVDRAALRAKLQPMVNGHRLITEAQALYDRLTKGC